MKPTITLAALAACAAVHGQVLFSTGFEAPTYTNGVSALGIQGWDRGFVGASIGNFGGSSQWVTNAVAASGSQSLLFDNTSDANTNSIRETLLLDASKVSVSTKVRMGGNNGAGRVAELRLYGYAGYYDSPGDFAVSIDGSGTVRAGRVRPGELSSAADPAIGFALAGTYADRWLTVKLAYDPLVGRTNVEVSGFGAGQATIATSLPITLGGAAQVELVSAANSIAAAKNGVVYFDNVNVIGPNPVPEPATLAALGLGCVSLVRKRRTR